MATKPKPTTTSKTKALTPLQARYVAENRATGCSANTFWHAPLEQCLVEIERVYEKRGKGEMVRAYYYALRTAGLLKEWTHVREPDGTKAFPRSTIQAQAWVSSILTTARRTGRLDWHMVFDDSRSSRRHRFLSLKSDIDLIGESYFSLNPWLTQTTLVEVWVEKTTWWT